MHNFSFDPLSFDHLNRLHRWLQKPHVREFWDDGGRTLEDVKQHYFYRSNVHSWIASIQGEPFAYLQMSLISENDEMAMWRDREKNTLGIDLFIGETRYLGKKLSVPLINAFITQCLKNYFPCRILVDPDSENTRAIKTYLNAGFTTLGELKLNGKLHLILIKECGNHDKNA